MKKSKKILIINLAILAIAVILGIYGGIAAGLKSSNVQMSDYLIPLWNFWIYYVLAFIYGIISYQYTKKKLKMENFYEGNIVVSVFLIASLPVSIIIDILFVIIVTFGKIIFRLIEAIF